ncbi:leucine-rich repeat-containing protein, putative [Ricinus communis]|uniref:Leucine-rich repeat-containing protein, putative n=1 Tax=Ricinus communis TaxID=3988 RepID=B9RGB6_RICCO|nr:leucine-rich repeat-containing protein, putative [Ricinus communis]
MNICMKKVEKSQFYQTLLKQIQTLEILDSFHRVLGSELKMQMVIYGIGSIESYETPRIQLSIAILMKKEFSWIGEIEVFDPVLSATESQVLEALGCSVLSVNEHGRRYTKKTRYLSYTRRLDDASEKFKPVYEAGHLRTFLHVDDVQWWGCHIDAEVTNDLLPKLMLLRILSLSHYNSLTCLADSIGKLKHLRYLDLSRTLIRRLPETKCSLYNLQTLILAYCVFLDELPTKFTMLINLCHLDISWTILGEIPSQMGKPRKLQKLTDFMLGKGNGSSIKELGELQNLQGKLCIWNLQNVVDAFEANMKSEQHQIKLEFRWDGNADDSQHEANMECLSIFEKND